MEPQSYFNPDHRIYVSLKSFDNRRDYGESHPSIEFQTNLKMYYYSSSSSEGSSCLTKIPEIDLRRKPFRYACKVFDSMPESVDTVSELLSQIDIPFSLDHNLYWVDIGTKTKTQLEDRFDLINHIVELIHQTLAYSSNVNNKRMNLGLRLVIEKRVYLPHCEFEAMQAVKGREWSEKRESGLRWLVTHKVQRMKREDEPVDIDELENSVVAAMRSSGIYDENLRESLMEQAMRQLESDYEHA